VLERAVVLTFVCGFERVVQWLGNVWEMGPEWERFISKGDVSLDVGEEGRT